MDCYGDKYDISRRKNYIKRTLKLGKKALKKKVQKFTVQVRSGIVYNPC